MKKDQANKNSAGPQYVPAYKVSTVIILRLPLIHIPIPKILLTAIRGPLKAL